MTHKGLSPKMHIYNTAFSHQVLKCLWMFSLPHINFCSLHRFDSRSIWAQTFKLLLCGWTAVAPSCFIHILTLTKYKIIMLKHGDPIDCCLTILSPQNKGSDSILSIFGWFEQDYANTGQPTVFTYCVRVWIFLSEEPCQLFGCSNHKHFT